MYGRNTPCLPCIKADMLEDESANSLFVSPKDGRHIEMNFVSDGYFTVVGSTREKRMQGAGFSAMNDVCEEDRQRVDDLVLAAGKAQQSIRVVYKVRLDDGSLKELYERVRFIKRENGKSLYYCTVEENDRGLQAQERRE